MKTINEIVVGEKYKGLNSNLPVTVTFVNHNDIKFYYDNNPTKIVSNSVVYFKAYFRLCTEEVTSFSNLITDVKDLKIGTQGVGKVSHRSMEIVNIINEQVYIIYTSGFGIGSSDKPLKDIFHYYDFFSDKPTSGVLL